MTTPHDDEPQTLVAACVQFDVRRGDVASNLSRAEAGIADAAKNGARLCVLPEMWSTSFLPSYDNAQIAAAEAAEARIAELSKQHAMTILGSGPESRDGAIYNCATLYDCGETKGSYRKVHLFSANAEHRHHRGGDEPLVVDTSAGRIGVMIGYDLRFPISRATTSARAPRSSSCPRNGPKHVHNIGERCCARVRSRTSCS